MFRAAPVIIDHLIDLSPFLPVIIDHLFLQVIIDYLLEGNADPNVFNDHGETPLHSAIKRHRRSHVQKFLARGGNPNKGKALLQG